MRHDAMMPVSSACIRDASGGKVLGEALLMSKRIVIPGCLVLMALAGCANMPTDTGHAETARLLTARGHEVSVEDDAGTSARLLAELSGRPLSVNDAIRIALVNNPQIKAEYARLGFAAADVYDAGRLSNPVLSASLMVSDVGSEANQVGFGLAQSFTDILFLRSRSRLAAGEFERVKQVMGANVLNIVADTEAAYVRLASSGQLLSIRESIATSATTSADLAQQFFEAGNISPLELALQQAAASEAELAVLQAQSEVAVARSTLNGLMGLDSTGSHWKIEERLPAPIATEDATSELLQLADAHRLDLAAARQRVTLQADALGITRSFRLLGDIDVGVETERETDRSRITGPTLALELPIFNQGQGRVARAEAAAAAGRSGIARAGDRHQQWRAARRRRHGGCQGPCRALPHLTDPPARSDRRAYAGGGELHARRPVPVIVRKAAGIRSLPGLSGGHSRLLACAGAVGA